MKMYKSQLVTIKKKLRIYFLPCQRWLSSGPKYLVRQIIRRLAFSLFGFTAVIILWLAVFFLLRKPWQYLIDKKYGLIYCSIYLLLLCLLVEEYSYFSLLKALENDHA